MEESHLFPFNSLNETSDNESDTSTSSDDEVIEDIIQMLDDVMDMSNAIINKLQDNDDEQDDENYYEQQVSIDHSTSSITEITTNLVQLNTSDDNNEKFKAGGPLKLHAWTIQEKLNVINQFKKSKNISQGSRQYHCDRKQVRNWLKQEQELQSWTKVPQLEQNYLYKGLLS